MHITTSKYKNLALLAALALPATAMTGAAGAQELEAQAQDRYQTQDSYQNEERIDVVGNLPADLSGLEAGPEIDGFISARRGRQMQVTAEDGTPTTVLVADTTDIKARGGFLGLGRTELGIADLHNGIPVTVETVQWEGGLVASRVRFKDDDYETAQMIRGATNQRFTENESAIAANAEAAEQLRGRVANIDQYNVVGTTQVYFDTGRWNLTPAGERELCNAAQQAQATDNALLLVVGYTDSVGDQDYNQELSERRAGRVTNYLQQQCGWEPWRMLTPTGMAESSPEADNETEAGRAQNRRVAVNILVSKAVEGM
ncbi:OmpA family protein [Aurantiacibacter poecillastricola]|uniref:OmpA family protein n=1 Tax=Aurantiacibacter poecillastricola TaxID=3064385 RepID=UPI00273EC0F7|nr:OmpA family protein [Aurantiacibacter sp. 219JJ12-13]MDP5260764.1 OmpA family protein [Aurantiacibacter sp. 219JJ12-13]